MVETSVMPAESRAAKTFRDIFDSGRPLLYVRSTEEQRVVRVLRETAARMPTAREVWTWTITEGLTRDNGAREPGMESARTALDFIAQHPRPGIFLLKDLHEQLRESPEVRRRLRDLYISCRGQNKYLVIVSP